MEQPLSDRNQPNCFIKEKNRFRLCQFDL